MLNSDAIATLWHCLQGSGFPLTAIPYFKIRKSSSTIPAIFVQRASKVAGLSAKELRDQLSRLMAEQLESLRKQVFGGLNKEELQQQEERLKLIRQVSADYLAALKRERLSSQD